MSDSDTSKRTPRARKRTRPAPAVAPRPVSAGVTTWVEIMARIEEVRNFIDGTDAEALPNEAAWEAMELLDTARDVVLSAGPPLLTLRGRTPTA